MTRTMMARLVCGLFLILTAPTVALAAWGAGDGACTAQSSTTGTTLACTVSTANLDAGNVVFLWFGGDNLDTVDGNQGLVTAVADSKSNTWKIDRCYTNANGSAGAGATTCLAHSVLTATLTSGVDTITVTHGSITSRASVVKEFTKSASSTVFAVAQPEELANDAADPGSITVSQTDVTEFLWLRATALERTSGGTWTPTVSFTTSGCNGTNSGTSTNDMEICGEYQIASVFSLASDPTGTAVDNASLYIAFKEKVMPTGFVQECHHDLGALGTTIDCIFGSYVTAGNLIACYTLDLSTVDTVTLSDTLSNTYTVQSPYYVDSTNLWISVGAYAKNITGGLARVRATWSASTNNRGIGCQEISGVDVTSPADGYVGQNQQNVTTTTDQISSTAITTTAAGYIFGATYDTSNNCVNAHAGTGYTGGLTDTSCNVNMESRATNGGGSYAATFTAACCATSDYTTIIQAFKSTAIRTLTLMGVGQ